MDNFAVGSIASLKGEILFPSPLVRRSLEVTGHLVNSGITNLKQLLE